MEQWTEQDTDGLLALSRQAGWDHTREDWQALLATGRLWGHRGPAGEVRSCGGLFEYDALSVLGMLLVTPVAQGRGLARELLQHLLQVRAEPRGTLMLVSGAGVEGLYQQFGFARVETLHKLKASRPLAPVMIPGERQMRSEDLAESDWPTLEKVDREVFGADRSAVLRVRHQQAVRGVLLRHERGTVLGYGWAIRQGQQLSLGPVVAFNRFAALKLIQDLVADHSGPLRLDLYGRDPALQDACVATGFVLQETQAVMTLGGAPLPGRRDHLYAPASQAWG